MALTPSSMLPLQTLAPEFNLPEVRSQKIFSLSQENQTQGTVVMFICNHCPYVKHILIKLVEIAHQYQKKGIKFIAISANDPERYPEDSPAKMADLAEQLQFPFPYLFDETQATAKAYKAECTPDFYLFNSSLRCVYRGRFDQSSPDNKISVTGSALVMAMDALLSGNNIDQDQKPSIGCNIKWKNQ